MASRLLGNINLLKKYLIYSQNLKFLWRRFETSVFDYLVSQGFVAFYWFKNERKILLVFICHSFSFNGHISPYIFSVYF